MAGDNPKTGDEWKDAVPYGLKECYCPHGHVAPYSGHFHCQECGLSFLSKSQTMLHEQKVHRVRHGNQPIQCNVCGRTFRSVSVYQIHMSTMHRRKGSDDRAPERSLITSIDSSKPSVQNASDAVGNFSSFRLKTNVGAKKTVVDFSKGRLQTKDVKKTAVGEFSKFQLKSPLNIQPRQDLNTSGIIIRSKRPLETVAEVASKRFRRGSSPNTCPVCNKTFHSASVFQIHMSSKRCVKPLDDPTPKKTSNDMSNVLKIVGQFGTASSNSSKFLSQTSVQGSKFHLENSSFVESKCDQDISDNIPSHLETSGR